MVTMLPPFVCDDCDYVGIELPDGTGCPVCVGIPRTEALAATMPRVQVMRFGLQKQRVTPPAPGRNDPCSCGSGKKAKKCCHR